MGTVSDITPAQSPNTLQPEKQLQNIATGCSPQFESGSLFRRHEKEGGRGSGHTISFHVAKTDAQLIQRLHVDKLSGSSSFSDGRTANKAVAAGMNQNRTEIRKWLRNSSAGQVEVFHGRINEKIGRGLTQKDQNMRDMQGIKIVLRRMPSNMGGGFYVLTSHPED